MNEQEIAYKKVNPYIQKNLNWPDHLISEYGRVPVQIGGNVKLKDFCR